MQISLEDYLWLSGQQGSSWCSTSLKKCINFGILTNQVRAPCISNLLRSDITVELTTQMAATHFIIVTSTIPGKTNLLLRREIINLYAVFARIFLHDLTEYYWFARPFQHESVLISDSIKLSAETALG